MSDDPAVNPHFFNASLIFMHYCDGSSYSSYRPDPIPRPADLDASLARIRAERGADFFDYEGAPAGAAPAQIWMRGRANLQAVVAYLLQNLGMAGAAELIVSGGSAGGTGVYLGLDYIRGWVPAGMRVAGNPDAGFFLDLPRAGGNDTWYRDCFAAAAPVWNGSDIASPACVAANGAEPWKCYLPEYSLPFIETPMLVSNSPIDMWGLGNILDLGCIPTMDNKTYNKMTPCDPAHWQLLQQWFDAFSLRLNALLAASPTSRSAFIPSCFVHEINVDYCSGQSLPNCRGWAKYIVAPSSGTAGAPTTLQQATAQWAANLFANYDAALAAGKRAAAAHAEGRVLAPAAGATTQWVDGYRYPNNPSCYYPPGR